SLYFFFIDSATSEIYTLSLHDALPIYISGMQQQLAELKAFTSELSGQSSHFAQQTNSQIDGLISQLNQIQTAVSASANGASQIRSEEHTSELQSRFDLVCRLLLEKKNN